MSSKPIAQSSMPRCRDDRTPATMLSPRRLRRTIETACSPHATIAAERRRRSASCVMYTGEPASISI